MTPSNSQSDELELPGIFVAADAASVRGQRNYLRLSAMRFISLFAAALTGALGFLGGTCDVVGALLLLAFVVAAFAEFGLIRFQPERAWYSGRAVAESVKTLSWRFAVKGEPFGGSLDLAEAERLLLERIREVVKKGSDRIDLVVGPAVVTESMRTLRLTRLEVRRAAYLLQRTQAQRSWYSTNAAKNQKRASMFRYALLAGELIAVVAAAVALGRDVPLDFAGVLAALVAAGAAWMALKQYSQLTSAYRVAAVELGIQESIIESVEVDKWDQAVADAEEAISREHTMWLASRGEEPIGK